MSLVRPALGHELAPRPLAHRRHRQVLDPSVDVLQALLRAHLQSVAALGVVRDVEGVVRVAVAGVVAALLENCRLRFISRKMIPLRPFPIISALQAITWKCAAIK